MFQLLVTALLITTFFVFFWKLGGAKLIAHLTHDPVAELQRRLLEVEDELAGLPPVTAGEAETTTFLRAHYEGERRRLKRQLQQAQPLTAAGKES